MRILGIDTATKFLSIGIYDNGKVYEYNLELGTRLSSLLAPTIKRVLDALDWRPLEIDYFACGLGPGSFTGMRVGISAIKGLAWSLKKPVIGISTLDILAKAIDVKDKYIVPAIDAKRGLIYCSLYKIKNDKLKRLAPYLLLSKKEFLKKLKADTMVCADAVNLYKEEILRYKRGVDILDKDYWYPKGHNIVALALEKIKEKKVKAAFDLQPIYLYPKECQIRMRP